MVTRKTADGVAASALTVMLWVTASHTTVNAKGVPVNVTCAKEACVAKLTLRGVFTVKVGHATKRESVVLGTLHFSLAKGATAIKNVTLNAKGKAALKNAKRHPVRLTLALTVRNKTTESTVVVA